jgi:hypothetical protein
MTKHASPRVRWSSLWRWRWTRQCLSGRCRPRLHDDLAPHGRGGGGHPRLKHCSRLLQHCLLLSKVHQSLLPSNAQNGRTAGVPLDVQRSIRVCLVLDGQLLHEHHFVCVPCLLLHFPSRYETRREHETWLLQDTCRRDSQRCSRGWQQKHPQVLRCQTTRHRRTWLNTLTILKSMVARELLPCI